MNRKHKQAIQRAFNAAGGGAALARLILAETKPRYTALDHTNMARRIAHWRNNGIPARNGYVLLIERLTGVSRHELAPDVYPGTAGQSE